MTMRAAGYRWMKVALVPVGIPMGALLYIAMSGVEDSHATQCGQTDPLPAECADEAAPRPGNTPQHPDDCHGNPNGTQDGRQLRSRGDIANLPPHLKDTLTRLACRPHSTLPIQFYSEADTPSQLFQYYILDTDGRNGSGTNGFQPNVFTSLIPGVNDTAQFTATGANCQLPTIGAVRLVLEPKPGLPTDPDDPEAFIDIITDVSGLFVINNESGWYEGWMIHDLTVAPVGSSHGHAEFGKITQADADRLARMGSGNNGQTGNYFTVDGEDPRFPSPSDHFPDDVPNVVPLHLSMGSWNALQQSDAHQYWEFNYTTNWIHPLWELPFTGGFPDHSPTEPADTYQDGELGKKASIVPGTRAGLNLDRQRAIQYGDNPDLPRDPDKFEAEDDAQREFRQRFIPSGLAREIFLDVYERLASFHPGVTDLEDRLRRAYSEEIACVDTDHNGIISAVEGDIDTPSCGFDDNARLFLAPSTYDRFAVTREINDGYLAPRFAPSQRAWVLSGSIVQVTNPVAASTGRDSDDR